MENFRHGKGISYYENGISKMYEGEWRLGEYHGEGIFYAPDGETIRWPALFNDWKEGHSAGYVYSIGIKRYEGGFDTGKYHGKGTLYNLDGSKIYEGDWV